MGVIPDVDPDTAIEQNTELATYLESELDVSVDLLTTSDYAGLVQAMTMRTRLQFTLPKIGRSQTQMRRNRVRKSGPAQRDTGNNG
ncbi:PhnD/SsuA/transferrin family substrate-binding protein [Natrinema sp. DC36]|uniref:PhnD/SsuA/transferrin family substrate-binding protein n=1 Tax=Natrinema sp. DC36 TaxID=2878680 RepID=UPI001CEFC42B|nr:PhnD/SsuA/transferrin family substrate-binding protein [Natrinema sp. DC36]